MYIIYICYYLCMQRLLDEISSTEVVTWCGWHHVDEGEEEEDSYNRDGCDGDSGRNSDNDVGSIGVGKGSGCYVIGDGGSVGGWAGSGGDKKHVFLDSS